MSSDGQGEQLDLLGGPPVALEPDVGNGDDGQGGAVEGVQLALGVDVPVRRRFRGRPGSYVESTFAQVPEDSTLKV